MNEFLVFIILFTYSHSNHISETLYSFLLQNYNNWECFIVDDDSIDKTNAVKHSENINNLYQNSFNEKLAVNSNNII